jgi:hypothetical protein
MPKKRKLTELEKKIGRSDNYYQLNPREQWDEDKILGILDWDGTEKWLKQHNIE